MLVRPFENIINEIEFISESSPDKIAIYTDELSITYKELNKTIKSTCIHLKNKGIKSGEIIALYYSNELYLLILFLSLAKINATSITIQKNFTKLQINEIINQICIDRVVTDNISKFDFKDDLPQIEIDNKIFFNHKFNLETINLKSNANFPLTVSIGSGTTGKPKIMILSHEKIYHRISIIQELENLTYKDITTSFSNMDYQSTQIRSLATLCTGASVVISKNKGYHYLNKYKITNIGISVFHIEQLLQYIERNNNISFKYIETLVLGFSTISSELRHKIKNLLCKNLLVGYGANECGAISISKFPHVYTENGTIGFPSNKILIEVVDKHNKKLGRNEVGLLKVKSPATIDGYVNDTISSRKNFKDGWFYTGDYVKQSNDNQLIYMGRADNVMIVNGINIYPVEIEQTLLKHKHIYDIYVTSIKSKIHQNIPICIVSLIENSSLNEKQLHLFSKSVLGSKTPPVFIINKIPRTNHGKIIKKDIDLIIYSKLKKLKG